MPPRFETAPPPQNTAVVVALIERVGPHISVAAASAAAIRKST